MSDAANKNTIDLKWFGKLSQKQLLAILAAFLIALVLTLLGFGNSCICFGMLVIAVILYMLPRLLGVENIKIMTLIGVVFAVCAILIGGLVMAPGFVDRNQSINDNDYFKNVELTFDSGTVTINADLASNPGNGEIYFVYGEVKAIGFQGISAIFDQYSDPLSVTTTIDTSTGNATYALVDQTVPLPSSSNLYAGYLAIGTTNNINIDIAGQGSVTVVGNDGQTYGTITGSGQVNLPTSVTSVSLTAANGTDPTTGVYTFEKYSSDKSGTTPSYANPTTYNVVNGMNVTTSFIGQSEYNNNYNRVNINVAGHGSVTVVGNDDQTYGTLTGSGQVNLPKSVTSVSLTAANGTDPATGNVYTFEKYSSDKPGATVDPSNANPTTYNVVNGMNVTASFIENGEHQPITKNVEINGDTSTNWVFLTGAHDGSTTSLSLFGCAYSTLMIMIVFFLIMILSFFMRGRMEKTRERMEKEGRLYPQGYGKCDNCGAVVLPGEVKCRKCGAYIDRPDEMKPKKKDFFECSECGAEVPGDATTCPKCGAKFDEDEFEVTHADGTVETTNEIIQCHECGEFAPANATFCAKCGAKFGKK